MFRYLAPSRRYQLIAAIAAAALPVIAAATEWRHTETEEPTELEDIVVTAPRDIWGTMVGRDARVGQVGMMGWQDTIFALVASDGGHEGATEQAQENQTSDCPVELSSGRKILQEVDTWFDGLYPFSFTRYYGGAGARNAEWASFSNTGWTSTFDVRLGFDTPAPGVCINRVGSRLCDSQADPESTEPVLLHTNDGGRRTFTYNEQAQGWVSDKPQSIERIVRAGTEWGHYTEDNGYQRFNQWGELLRTEDLHGIGWSFTYNAGKLISATHTSGRAFTNFVWEVIPNTSAW